MRGCGWKGGLGMGGLVFLLALAQQALYPLDFGPYEALRQQAHAQCQGYQAQGAEAYLQCLAQVSVALCMGPTAPGMDFMAGSACLSASSAGYPQPGKAVLTKPSYRVELVVGIQRERDPRTGGVIREVPETSVPRLLFTLERTPQGVYLGTWYSGNQVAAKAWVSPACEVLGSDGRPTADLNRCPVFPQKAYLLVLVPSPIAGLPPNALYFKAGRLVDDFDGDGVVEMGYLITGGSGGRQFTSGYVQAVGYDPKTGLLKYGYALVARESQNPYTTFVQETLSLYRVR